MRKLPHFIVTSLFAAAPVFAAPPTTVPAALPATPAVQTPPAAPLLIRNRPEVKFDQIALTDAIDYFRDLTGLNINVNWQALETVGVSRETPVSLRLRNVRIRTALTKTLEAAAPGLLTFYVDENVVQITTHQEADARPITRVYSVADLIMDVPDFTNFPEISLQSSGSRSRTAGGNTSGGGGGSGGSGGGGNNNLFGGAGGGQARAAVNAARTPAERAQALIDLIQTTIRPEVWNVNGGTSAIRYANGQLIVTAPLEVQRAIGG
jgi:hypothetical protein